MPKERGNKTPNEAKALGFMNKTELKSIGLMPGDYQRPAATVWQGRGTYLVWNPAQCIPYKYETPPSVIRKRACREKAREWISFGPFLVDTETTGLDEFAEVIEISIIDLHGEVVFTSLCKPVGEVTAGAFQVHKISNDILDDKPTWPEIYPRIVDLIQGSHVVIYNSDFDKRILNQTCARHELPEIEFDAHCLMRLYSEFHGDKFLNREGFKFQKLVDAMEQCNLPMRPAHRASADCLMTLDLLKKLASSKRSSKTTHTSKPLNT